MSTDQYTPTDNEVREDFAYPWEGFEQNRPARIAAYDRWLVAHDARVKAEALRDAADSMRDNAASPYCMPCHHDDANLLSTIADRIEDENTR